MFDELQHLRDDPKLARLLRHYADLCAGDREKWQDRLMEMGGVEGRDLTRLHGELIGFQWVEQNTGMTPALRAGAVPGCYRVTAAGVRALKRAATREEDDAEPRAAA